MVFKQPTQSALSAFARWRQYLVDETHDMDENGDFTIPDIYFYEKYPDLTPKHVLQIQKLQRSK